MGALERRYRRLLAWYPAGYRKSYGEEMIGVLLAAAPEGSNRPGPAGVLDLIGGGLRARFRSAVRSLADADWADALAICSVAVPVILLGYFTVPWLWGLHWHVGLVHVNVERGLIVMAIAVPPLLALRYRRTGAFAALALAGWLSVYTLGGISPNWGGYWIIYGQAISGSLALLIGAAALGVSAGPRRARDILTAKGWLVLAGSGIAMGLIHPYLWPRPLWLAAIIVLTVLAIITAGLVLTIPRPVAPGVLLLLAVPAYPGAVWAIGISGSFGADTSGFPNLVFLPTVLVASLALAAIWRSRRRQAA